MFRFLSFLIVLQECIVTVSALSNESQHDFLHVISISSASFINHRTNETYSTEVGHATPQVSYKVFINIIINALQLNFSLAGQILPNPATLTLQNISWDKFSPIIGNKYRHELYVINIINVHWTKDLQDKNSAPAVRAGAKKAKIFSRR